MEQRATRLDASLTVDFRRTSVLKTMNDRYPTSGLTRTKVGKAIKNGERLVCVGEDQDGFDGVKQANVNSSGAMNSSMESNNERKVDPNLYSQ